MGARVLRIEPDRLAVALLGVGVLPRVFKPHRGCRASESAGRAGSAVEAPRRRWHAVLQQAAEVEVQAHVRRADRLAVVRLPKRSFPRMYRFPRLGGQRELRVADLALFRRGAAAGVRAAFARVLSTVTHVRRGRPCRGAPSATARASQRYGPAWAGYRNSTGSRSLRRAGCAQRTGPRIAGRCLRRIRSTGARNGRADTEPDGRSWATSAPRPGANPHRSRDRDGARLVVVRGMDAGVHRVALRVGARAACGWVPCDSSIERLAPA